MCLVYDIDEYVERGISCCAGQNQCINAEAVIHRCPMYASLSQRSSATEAVREMLGGETSLNCVAFLNLKSSHLLFLTINPVRRICYQ